MTLLFRRACVINVKALSALGGTITRMGNLPTPNEENWFLVTFSYNNQPAYHPTITLTPATGTTMVMDVQGTCGAAPGCGLGGGNGMTMWEAFGGGAPTGQTYSPTPSVGQLYIRIYQTGGARTCAQYTLTVTD